MECAAEVAGSQAGMGKLSRKERTRLKKEAKRQLRKGGSDDEDLAADRPAFKVRQRRASLPASPLYRLPHASVAADRWCCRQGSDMEAGSKVMSVR